MKKFKLEFGLVSVFLIFIVLLMWSSVSAVFSFLPYVIIGICGIFVLSLLNPFRKKSEQQGNEVYAPKYFSQSVASTVVAIGIIVFATVILNKDRFSANLDFTKNKVNSLSAESIKFIDSLKKQVQMVCIPSKNITDNYCDESSDLLSLYAKKSTNIIYMGQVDFKNKDLIAQLKPSGFSRIMLVTDNNKSEIEGKITESKITNALVNLIKFKKTVYFLSGSGEPPLSANSGDRNYSDIVSALKSKAYEAREWNLKDGDLPADAQVLVAGDNSIVYGQAAENILMNFKNRGGKIILIVNPYREQGLNQFYASIKLKLANVLVTLNPNSPLGKQLAQQSLVRPPSIVSNFSSASPITLPIAEAFKSQAVMPVDGGRPIEILEEGKDSKTQATVLMSAISAAPITMTEAARNKINLNQPLTLTPDKKFDPNKTWNMGVDVQIQGDKPENQSEVVVFGFSLVNLYSKEARISEELIPLSVAHLYQDKELVSIPPRDVGPQHFNLSRNPGAWLPLFAGVLPVVTALMGFLIWMRRRSA